MAKFLSDDWFEMVNDLNANSGDLNLPPTLSSLIINAVVSGNTPVNLHLIEGKIYKDLHSNAQSTLNISDETLFELISTKDANVAIEAFMMGKIRIDGDMSAMMSLQSAKPSAEQKELFKEILNNTEF